MTAIAFLVAIAVLPSAVARIAAGHAGLTMDDLPARVARGFDAWAFSGGSSLSTDLTSAVCFWTAFHAVKPTLSIALLLVLVMLRARIWSTTRAPSRRILRGFAGTIEVALTALAVLLVIVNVQGTIAPLSSVLSFLPTTRPTPGMAAMRDQLTAGVTSPAASVLIGDFRAYHWAVVVSSAIVLVGLSAVAVLVWMRWRPDPQRRRQLVLVECVLAVGLVFIGLVLAANFSTIVATAPAVVSFLSGGL